VYVCGIVGTSEEVAAGFGQEEVAKLLHKMKQQKM
jgi:hypothetical protein